MCTLYYRKIDNIKYEKLDDVVEEATNYSTIVLMLKKDCGLFLE